MYFLNKAFVTEPTPWSLISIGSMECTVDIKISVVPTPCDFYSNSLGLDLTDIVRSNESTVLIPITSTFDLEQALYDAEFMRLHWKTTDMRRIGMRYVLMRVKGFNEDDPSAQGFVTD